MQQNHIKYYVVNKINQEKVEILLYGEIGPYDVSANDFIRELKSLDKEYSAIDLRINSGGGSVFEGIAIYNALKASPATITVYIDGLAASMASIIALAGNKIYISKNAMMMTHLPSLGSYGNSQLHKRNTQLLEAIEQTMLDIYAEKTGKETAVCKQLFMSGTDSWFNAQEAIDHGLADELYESPIKLAASTKNVQEVYAHYAAQIESNHKKQHKTMKQIHMTAELLALFPNLHENSTQEAIEAEMKALAAMAAKADQLQANLHQVAAEMSQLETSFNDYKKAEARAKVQALFDKACDEGRCSKVQAIKLTALYGDDVGEATAFAATLVRHTPITDALGDDVAKEVAALKAQAAKDLFNNGGLERLKAIAPDVFKEKYKELTGKDHQDK